MTVEGNEKISVNYLPTDMASDMPPYEPEVLQSHSNYKTRAHPVDYEGIASNPLMKPIGLFNIQPFALKHFSYSQKKEPSINDYLDSHTDRN